ncbi:MAG: IclR family transcriptional regulator [Xanthobacteraceae bacterium]|nr:IclR family transcriptional regulator [Xanthobacteraceae bacterium]MBV9237935.1 IclR family transcriptional regulator [Xanthobacteraceae bacterium]MBV9629484.1 IclR family transcriptional regulator [Xanthobacteraceae bacterium]
MPDATASKNVRAVERAIDILECFLPEKPWMSVLDIQRKVPLSRPTLYRLLQTLIAKGLVRAEGDPQRFALDFGVGRIAHSWIAGIDVVALARPILEELRTATGETTAFFLRRGDIKQCVAELASPHVLAISRGLGETDHLWRGASGKAILAFLADNEAADVMRRLPKSINKTALAADVGRARADGYFVSRGEVFVGAIAIAAPYFDHTGRVAGSVGVFGPDARLDERWVVRAAACVVKSASELSTACGHTASTRKPGTK